MLSRLLLEHLTNGSAHSAKRPVFAAMTRVVSFLKPSAPVARKG